MILVIGSDLYSMAGHQDANASHDFYVKTPDDRKLT